MHDLRAYYRDIAVGEDVRFNGEQGRVHIVSVVEIRGPRVVVRIDDETVEMAAGQVPSPVGDGPSGAAPHHTRRDTVQVGIEVTRDLVGSDPGQTSMIALSGDVRLYVGPPIAFSHARYRFPIPYCNWSRDHNWLTRAPYGRHLGADLYAPRGSQVVSVCDGIIQEIRDFDPRTDAEDHWGRLVAVRGEDGFVYTYAHCDVLAPHLEAGVQVQRGNAIGSVGKAGFESADTPAHLHFEMFACRRPDRFRFAFEPNPTEPIPARLLPAEAEGFAVNPFPYLCEWFRTEG